MNFLHRRRRLCRIIATALILTALLLCALCALAASWKTLTGINEKSAAAFRASLGTERRAGNKETLQSSLENAAIVEEEPDAAPLVLHT